MSARGRVREGSLAPGPPSQARVCQGAGHLPSSVGPIIGWPSPPVVVPARCRCMAIRVWPCCAPRLAESAVGLPCTMQVMHPALEIDRSLPPRPFPSRRHGALLRWPPFGGVACGHRPRQLQDRCQVLSVSGWCLGCSAPSRRGGAAGGAVAQVAPSSSMSSTLPSSSTR